MGWFRVFLAAAVAAAQSDFVDYQSLPRDTIFPGPWESNIRAPVDKSRIIPVKIFKSEGVVWDGEAVLQDADPGASWGIGPGGMVTFEFAENIAGKYALKRCRSCDAIIKAC
jgi:hypothetical protein